MSAKPFEWNVVVVGHWNPAILTPKGIAQRLLGLEEETPIQVEVPLSGVDPPRVRHGGFIIVAAPDRLCITLEEPRLENLVRASQVAISALESLPETPISAVGFNIQFKLEDPPECLMRVTKAEMDDCLSDGGFAVTQTNIQRSIEFNGGLINLSVVADSESNMVIVFNFHRASAELEELKQWLGITSAAVKDECSRILNMLTGLPFEEEWE